jgi:hypothetical protein
MEVVTKVFKSKYANPLASVVTCLIIVGKGAVGEKGVSNIITI